MLSISKREESIRKHQEGSKGKAKMHFRWKKTGESITMCRDYHDVTMWGIYCPNAADVTSFLIGS